VRPQHSSPTTPHSPSRKLFDQAKMGDGRRHSGTRQKLRSDEPVMVNLLLNHCRHISPPLHLISLRGSEPPDQRKWLLANIDTSTQLPLSGTSQRSGYAGSKSVITSVDRFVFLRLGVPCHHGDHMRSSVLDSEYIRDAKLWANARTKWREGNMLSFGDFGDIEAISLLQRRAEEKKLKTKPRSAPRVFEKANGACRTLQ